MIHTSAPSEDVLALRAIIAKLTLESRAKDQILALQTERVADQEQRLAALRRQIEHLLEQFRLSRQRLFGASSEKDSGQSELFNEAEVLVAGSVAEEDESVEPQALPAAGPVRPSRGGRKPLSAHLPRVEVRHALALDQRRCPCGCELKRIGEETSEQLDLIPARGRGTSMGVVHVTLPLAGPLAECRETSGTTHETATPADCRKRRSGPAAGHGLHLRTSASVDACPSAD